MTTIRPVETPVAALAEALAQARKLCLAGRPGEAVATLLPLLDRMPRHPALLHEVGMCHWTHGEHAAAAAIFDRFLDIEPGNRNAQLFRLHMAFVSEDHATALARAERVIALLPDEAAPRMVQARLWHRAGQLRQARDAFLALLKEDEDNLALLLDLARCQHAMGEHAAGLALVERILEREPSRLDALAVGIHCAIWLGEAGMQQRLAGQASALLDTSQGGQGSVPLADALSHLLCHLDPAPQLPKYALWLDAICRKAGVVNARLLWLLYQKADLLGLGQQGSALLEALLAKRDIRLAQARDILHAVHALGAGAVDLLAPRLREALAEGAGAGFELALAPLQRGAGPALAGRQRAPARSAEEALWLSALLLEAGRRRLALRYLRRATRAHPADAALWQSWVLSLVDAGEVDMARREMQRLPFATGLPGDEAKRIAALAHLALDEPEAALRLMDELDGSGRDPSLAAPRFQALLRLGRGEAAAALMEQAPGGPARQRLQRNASLNGLRLIEHQLESMGAAPPATAQFVGPAIREIDVWLAARNAIPRVIMQYWDTDHPPPALQAIMASWQAAEGFEYLLFDRASARHFLRRHLGPEWEAALRLARHPAEESDYFRLCFLLVQGGVYADCDDRLLHALDPLLEGRTGLVAFREPTGTIGNNLLLASPRSPVLAQAAIAARQALARGDNDSPWAKTGPALLTRTVASALQEAALAGTDPQIHILPGHLAQRCVQMHVPLAYKRIRLYWNEAASVGGTLAGLHQTLRGAAPG